MQFTPILGAVIPQVFDSMRYGNGITLHMFADSTQQQCVVDVVEQASDIKL
jgi:hypothetical protein